MAICEAWFVSQTSAQQKVADARQPVTSGLFSKHLPNKKLKSCWCTTTCDAWPVSQTSAQTKTCWFTATCDAWPVSQTSAQQKVADARQPVTPGLFPKHLPNKKLMMQGNLWRLACFLNICPTKSWWCTATFDAWPVSKTSVQQKVADARQPVTPGLFPKHLPNKKLLMHGSLWRPACFPNSCLTKSFYDALQPVTPDLFPKHLPNRGFEKVVGDFSHVIGCSTEIHQHERYRKVSTDDNTQDDPPKDE
jgi:hypothetical protein